MAELIISLLQAIIADDNIKIHGEIEYDKKYGVQIDYEILWDSDEEDDYELSDDSADEY